MHMSGKTRGQQKDEASQPKCMIDDENVGIPRRHLAACSQRLDGTKSTDAKKKKSGGRKRDGIYQLVRPWRADFLAAGKLQIGHTASFVGLALVEIDRRRQRSLEQTASKCDISVHYRFSMHRLHIQTPQL